MNFRVTKFWMVLKMAMDATRSCHLGRRPGVLGRTGMEWNVGDDDGTIEVASVGRGGEN